MKVKPMFMCDKCKHPFVYFNDEQDNMFLKIQPYYSTDYYGTEPVYLCPNCTKKFELYMGYNND